MSATGQAALRPAAAPAAAAQAAAAMRAAVTAVLLLCPILYCSRDLVVLKPGDAAPPFSLEDLDGRRHTLADYRGRHVMIRFWADWCKSCRTEMPIIEEKYRQFGRAGFAVLALNVAQDRQTAARFAKEVGISYPVLLDSDGRTADAFGVLGLPTTFLVDEEGRILEEILGDMNRRSLGALLDPVLGKPAPDSQREGP